MTYKLYIGSNNTTGKIELDLIEQKLNEVFDGYTIEHATGYWKGVKENNVLITVASDESTVINVIKRLKKYLKQDAIAYHKVDEMRFI